MHRVNGAPAGMRAPVRGFALTLLSIAAAGIWFAGLGCSSGGSTTSQTLVKSINAYVPQAGVANSLTLFAGSIYLGAEIGFGQVGSSGGYASIPSGSYTLYASVPGTTGVLATLNGQTFSGNNTAYTVIGAGQSGQSGALAPQIIVMPNYLNNQLTLPSGSAAIRVVNVSLNTHPVGLYSTSSGVPTSAVAAGAASVSYGYSAGSNAYEAVPTGTLTSMAVVDSTAPGVALALSSTTNLNTTTFAGGNAYTLIIYGQPGNAAQPFGCTWVQDYPAP